MPELKLMVVTPEKTLVNCQSDSVVVPLVDGLKGFLPNHAAMIGRLGPGVMTVQEAGQKRRYFVDGGFVQMEGDTLSVLTGTAVLVSELSAAELEHKLVEIKRNVPDSPSAKLARERQITVTTAMLRAARQAV